MIETGKAFTEALKLHIERNISTMIAMEQEKKEQATELVRDIEEQYFNLYDNTQLQDAILSEIGEQIYTASTQIAKSMFEDMSEDDKQAYIKRQIKSADKEANRIFEAVKDYDFLKLDEEDMKKTIKEIESDKADVLIRLYSLLKEPKNTK